MTRPRVIIYSAILCGLIALFAASLYLRVPLKVNVLRDRATLVRETGDGRIENVYRLQIINTAEHPRSFIIEASGLPRIDVAIDAPQPVEVPAASSRALPVRLRVDPTGLQAGSHRVSFRVTASDDPRVVADEQSVFFSR